MINILWAPAHNFQYVNFNISTFSIFNFNISWRELGSLQKHRYVLLHILLQ